MTRSPIRLAVQPRSVKELRSERTQKWTLSGNGKGPFRLQFGNSPGLLDEGSRPHPTGLDMGRPRSPQNDRGRQATTMVRLGPVIAL